MSSRKRVEVGAEPTRLAMKVLPEVGRVRSLDGTIVGVACCSLLRMFAAVCADLEAATRYTRMGASFWRDRSRAERAE